MADAVYGKAREKFANGEIDWVDDTIKVILIDSADYSVSIDADEYLDDIAGDARVATATLANKSNSLGVLDADDATFSSVSGDVSEALVIYKDTGVEGTSPLIAYIDSASGLPVTPNGGDITVSWDSGANKILKL